MTDYEPTPEQVEAAAIALSGETREYAFYEYPYSEVDRDRIRTKARAALTAAGPLIEREARDRIAAEVRKMRPFIRTARNGREDRVLRQDAVARAIARGEGS